MCCVLNTLTYCSDVYAYLEIEISISLANSQSLSEVFILDTLITSPRTNVKFDHIYFTE